MNQKQLIIGEIRNFVAYENRHVVMTDKSFPTVDHERAGHGITVEGGRDCRESGLWQPPLVGFADVREQTIRSLRRIAHPLHQMPEEVLPDANIVIACFVPFAAWVVETNRPTTKMVMAARRENGAEAWEPASPEWAESYELTNAMLGRLNEHIIHVVHKLGYEAATAPEAGTFYRDEITSRWSFRHFAYAAGLGTFGLNNMLITEKGCAGRFTTVVTNLRVTPDKPKKEDACLFKRNGSCGLCVGRCPSEALKKSEPDRNHADKLTVEASGADDGCDDFSHRATFDRRKCYAQCLKNAALYTEFGSSYASGDGQETDSGSEVCGKCLTGLPCTYKIP